MSGSGRRASKYELYLPLCTMIIHVLGVSLSVSTQLYIEDAAQLTPLFRSIKPSTSTFAYAMTQHAFPPSLALLPVGCALIFKWPREVHSRPIGSCVVAVGIFFDLGADFVVRKSRRCPPFFFKFASLPVVVAAVFNFGAFLAVKSASNARRAASTTTPRAVWSLIAWLSPRQT